MMEEEGAVIAGLLVGLNVIDANLCMKGEDLDSQVLWPLLLLPRRAALLGIKMENSSCPVSFLLTLVPGFLTSTGRCD